MYEIFKKVEVRVSRESSLVSLSLVSLFKMTMRMVATVLALLCTHLTLSHGFVQLSSRRTVGSSDRGLTNGRTALLNSQAEIQPAFVRSNNNTPRTHSVACFGFKLPPGKRDNGLQEILVGALSIAGLIAFLASPLGGLFFAALNGVLALVLLTPLLLIFAFNVWQFFNTTEGNCPSCGAPIRVLKDGSPSICLSCGSILESSTDGSIDFVPGGSSDIFEQENSFFGGFLGDSLGSSRQSEEKKGQYRRERTIIDVDVEEIEKK